MISTSGARQIGAIALALSLSFFAAGCKKKAPAPSPPVVTKAPVPPVVEVARPVVTQFEAEPSTVERGTSSTLRWAVTGQTNGITITPGIGSVDASGSRQVFPSATTTYTLRASGPGGDATSTATVTVTNPVVVPPIPTAAAGGPDFGTVLRRDVKDALFDYDKSDIREDARSVLTRNADVLKPLFSQYPNASVLVEGHADERGSAEYNLGLSDRRATAAKEFLIQLGVTGDRMRTVGRGTEDPDCTDSNEACWQKNRRARFKPGQ